MKRTSSTRNLREKLGITQNELSFFAGTRRAMIASHESGEKNLNLDASVKIDLINMCVVGVFDDKTHLHKTEAVVYDVPGVRKHRFKYERTKCMRKLLIAERSLATFDEERDALHLHLNRLARLDFTQLVGFTAQDIDWLGDVMLKMKVKLANYSAHARMELEVEVAAQQAALAVYDATLATLEVESTAPTPSTVFEAETVTVSEMEIEVDVLEVQLAQIEAEFKNNVAFENCVFELTESGRSESSSLSKRLPSPCDASLDVCRFGCVHSRSG